MDFNWKGGYLHIFFGSFAVVVKLRLEFVSCLNSMESLKMRGSSMLSKKVMKKLG
jgi:hypothetical protein